MSDELDPGLRRLFAETAEHPADEAFVSAVTNRTSREGLFVLITRRLAPAIVPIVAPVALAATLALVAGLSAGLITPLVDASPAGLAAGLGFAIAGVICFRLLSPLVSPRR